MAAGFSGYRGSSVRCTSPDSRNYRWRSDVAVSSGSAP